MTREVSGRREVTLAFDSPEHLLGQWSPVAKELALQILMWRANREENWFLDMEEKANMPRPAK